MDNNQITTEENTASDASTRVYGTPTIDELRMRILVRQQEKKKKRNKKSLR